MAWSLVVVAFLLLGGVAIALEIRRVRYRRNEPTDADRLVESTHALIRLLGEVASSRHPRV
jgi:hypothetical protein